jgi:3-oxoadipate enol-lactonase
MVRECSATIGARSVRYLEAGSGWPLVLLHGFPLHADMWRPQLEQSPAGWRLLAPDLRGFGPSADGVARTLNDMAGDLVEWLDALRIERAVIGGLSMGGYVTLALFRSAPERFTGLILANTRSAADSDEARAGRDTMSALVREKGPAAVADAMLPKLLGETSRRTHPELESLIRALVAANRADGLDGAIHAMKSRADATPLLPGIGLPALVIAGAEDTIVPTHESEEMNRLLPRSHLVVLPRAGHLSNLENAADFSEALGNFLRANI